ncbi:MAG: ATP-binding protein [Caulobacteraceae bacterium]
MPSAPLHFLVGSTGAGKTTYAMRFCEAAGAARFSIDEWMTTLFWMDAPQPIDAAWAMERVERCSARIWETAVQIARLGAPCMLEMGFASRSTRRKYAALAHEAGLSVQLHLLDVAVEERWTRVQARNRDADNAGQLRFAVTREMFDFTESFWEPPTGEEMAEYDGIWVRS